MDLLYKAWSESMDYFYEEQFYEPIVKKYTQFRIYGADRRESRGRVFSNGLEIYLFAFFIGLYKDERRPLQGKKRNFRMEVFRWGHVGEAGRKKYDEIQDYIFAALIAKSDIDLISLDKGRMDVEEVVSILMTTLNEYANTGFYEIAARIEKAEDYFLVYNNFFEFFKEYCPEIDKC